MVIESSGIDNSLTEAQLTALITEELQALLTEGLSTPSPNIATTTDSTLIKSEETAKELMVIVLVGAFSASVAVIVTLIGTVIVAILIIRHKRNRLSKHREQTSSQTKLNPV